MVELQVINGLIIFCNKSIIFCHFLTLVTMSKGRKHFGPSILLQLQSIVMPLIVFFQEMNKQKSHKSSSNKTCQCLLFMFFNVSRLGLQVAEQIIRDEWLGVFYRMINGTERSTEHTLSKAEIWHWNVRRVFFPLLMRKLILLLVLLPKSRMKSDDLSLAVLPKLFISWLVLAVFSILAKKNRQLRTMINEHHTVVAFTLQSRTKAATVGK